MKYLPIIFLIFILILGFFSTVEAQGIGTITKPEGVPDAGANPAQFVGSLIRNSLSLAVIVGFIVFFFWIIFAGYRYITSAGDPKGISQAWNQILWGLIGMVVILSSFRKFKKLTMGVPLAILEAAGIS